MTYFSVNYNAFNSNFIPNLGLFNNISITNPITALNFNTQNMYSFDTYTNSNNDKQAEMQKEFFEILFAIMCSNNINHTPTENILNNFRPYNYNEYGKNGTKISQLDPKMQEKTMQLLDYAKSEGLNVSITSGYRTKEEQAELLRTRPQFAAKKSHHCTGKAIDISIIGGSDADYKKLGDYAKSIGMRWGGDFSKVKERWHFDIG